MSILASRFTYISGVFRAILSLDLKLHDIIRTDLGTTVSSSDWPRSIYQWQFQAATENTVIRARGGRGEGKNETPFSGEFLGW